MNKDDKFGYDGPYYFTFGTDHNHHVSGMDLDATCILEVQGKDWWDARRKVFVLIGQEWSFQYTKDELETLLKNPLFSRGIVRLP